MPRQYIDSSSETMEHQIAPKTQLRFGMNGSHAGLRKNSLSRSSTLEDDALKALTHEEKECLMFFEETIDSLEQQDLSSGDSTPVNGRSTPTYSFNEERGSSPKEEIIDLVQINPEEAEDRNTINHSPLPVGKIYTEQQDEFKLKQEITENYHTLDYYPPPPPMVTSPKWDRPLPATLTDQSQHSFAYFHPIGSIPTPVIIAQKIAERKAGNGHMSPTSILDERRRSFESDKSAPLSPDNSGRLGTVPKPGRFPSNIIIMGSGKEYNQTISKASVSVQERKVQMLANLTGSPNFSPELEEMAVRKTPNRSLSFRDPVPEQTRTEALSKLGLVKEKTVTDHHRQTGYRSMVVYPSHVPSSKTESNGPQNDQNIAKKGASTDHHGMSGYKSIVVNHSQVLSSKTQTVSNEPQSDYSSAKKGASASLHAQSDYKSKIVKPSQASPSKTEALSDGPPNDQNIAKKGASADPHGGIGYKSMVVPPSFSPSVNTEIMSNAPQSSDSSAETGALPPYSGVKSVTFGPDACSARKFSHHNGSKSFSGNKSRSLDIKRTCSIPRTSGFRPQGVTVQFSGRGSTDESRREALRKLGLLK
ncbi:proline and serine-rich protein 2-like isoform X2 [Polyodon spathula]|uniref:proline and serine-rich protein 2-like isoform X2 n=1 Tax=Polyodon spathula TaxID=7913 RepID=UPI001B7E243D|nr:proline and serine-rich protein 2-like isoform X2 [Polyodon spathula]